MNLFSSGIDFNIGGEEITSSVNVPSGCPSGFASTGFTSIPFMKPFNAALAGQVGGVTISNDRQAQNNNARQLSQWPEDNYYDD